MPALGVGIPGSTLGTFSAERWSGNKEAYIALVRTAMSGILFPVSDILIGSEVERQTWEVKRAPLLLHICSGLDHDIREGTMYVKCPSRVFPGRWPTSTVLLCTPLLTAFHTHTLLLSGPGIQQAYSHLGISLCSLLECSSLRVLQDGLVFTICTSAPCPLLAFSEHLRVGS